MKSLQIHAGPKALAHIRERGLKACDIAIVAGAAGGPKGLILQALDQWLFGHWLPSAPRERTLIGASIGAWRMAAGAHADPVAAFERLGHLYCEQRYPHKPSAEYVAEVCRQLLHDFLDGHEAEIVHHAQHRVQILTVRGRRLLAAPRHRLATIAGFAAAGLANAASRTRLAAHLERIVIGDPRDPAFWLKAKFDAFDTYFAPLQEDNLFNALLASGTLPFIMPPVTEIAHAPAGFYWDGGLIDYHLALPYSRVAGNLDGGLVLYPHFTDHIVPGWFDKPLPWRRAGLGRNREWLDNVLLISPSPAFLQTLSRSKLPDRKDFLYYGLNHDFRIQNWRLAVGEGERLRDDFVHFIEQPDVRQVKPI
ncbi:MAG: patatin-like phospholipase family protein [Herminiimonas sp.]|nr:patatin-like phospholipase family protein [Herminiimonas sp.]